MRAEGRDLGLGKDIVCEGQLLTDFPRAASLQLFRAYKTTKKARKHMELQASPSDNHQLPVTSSPIVPEPSKIGSPEEASGHAFVGSPTCIYARRYFKFQSLSPWHRHAHIARARSLSYVPGGSRNNQGEAPMT